MGTLVKRFRLLFLLFPFFYACKTSFYAPPPEYAAQAPVYTPKPSVIAMPITLSFEVLNKEINKQLSGLLYDDQDFDAPVADNLKVSVYRTKREIVVDGLKNKLRFKVPLEIYAVYRFQACSFCPEIIQGTRFEMDLTLVSTIEIGSDWQLKVNTAAMDYSFPVKPKLDIGFTSVDISSIVKSALNSNMMDITYSLDQEIARSIPVRTYMEDAWKTMQDPILLDSAYKTWLVLKPNYIMMQQLNCTKTEIVLNTGLETLIETKLGEKPKVVKKNTLESPFIKEKVDNTFQVELPVNIDFDFATALARQNLKDSVFTISKKKKIKIDDIEIYGKGGDVFVKATLSGNLQGVVYLRGKPSIDTLTHKIYFADFDFDIQTKNGLLKVANWLAHGSLKKIFQQNFTYNIANDMAMAKSTLQDFLQGYTYNNIFTVKGQIGNMHLQRIFSDEKGITAIFKAQGTAGIQLHGFGE